MHWIHLTDEGQLQDIVIRSQERTQVIFKYSSRCGLSDIVYKRLQVKCCPESADFYFLDLVAYRNISKQVAERFRVPHQSPQVLVIKDGECIFDESHMSIDPEEIMEQAVFSN